MAQHDYVIANGTGAAVRSDINNGLAAIVSQNSGTTEPATMYAYQWWADTTTGLLKIRNAANNAWITVGTLADANLGLLTSGSTLTAALGSASTPGITFTGDLNTGIFSPGADQVAISTNGTGRLFVDASGSVGLGTSQNPTTGGFPRPVFFLKQFSDPSSGFAGIHIEASGDQSVLGIGYNGTANAFEFDTSFRGTGARRAIVFKTTGAECARIDTAGRLLVGTTSSTSTSRLVVRSNTSTSFGAIDIAASTTGGALTVGDTLGILRFTDLSDNIYASISAVNDAQQSAGDYPGRLVFSVTQDGSASPTERVRIVNSGTANFYANADVVLSRSNTGAGIANVVFGGYHSATNTSNGTASFFVTTNGNVTNTNNSYGAISDAKLKENIVDAGSQWSDIKALQVRKYNLKAETGQQTHTQIGLVAQEAELVSPGLVSESPDRDEDGNETGEVTKSVNYSVLYMKAVKALQEAMERIETLEAKVAALEAQ
jgi:hypothetical protein